LNRTISQRARWMAAIATTALSAAGAAQAQTTLTEDFNHGVSLVGGAYRGNNTVSGWLSTGTADAVSVGGANSANADNFISLANGGALTYGFALSGTSDLDLSFWYTRSSSDNSFIASVTLTGQTPIVLLRDGTHSGNPGADQNKTAQYGTTFSGLAAGDYSLTFNYTGTARGNSVFQFDDVAMTISAVPEPQPYALLLAGLGAVGFMARRRRRTDPT